MEGSGRIWWERWEHSGYWGNLFTGGDHTLFTQVVLVLVHKRLDSCRLRRRLAYAVQFMWCGAMLPLSYRNSNNYNKKCRTWLVMLPMSYMLALFTWNSQWPLSIKRRAQPSLWRRKPLDRWAPMFNHWVHTLSSFLLSNSRCINKGKGPSEGWQTWRNSCRRPNRNRWWCWPH